jgi:hypothetical protein
MESRRSRWWVGLLATVLLLGPGLAFSGPAQRIGLRFAAPPDGTTVEPGQTLTVIVEPLPGVTPTFVALLSTLFLDFREQRPFIFAVTIPEDAPLGPGRVTADGLAAGERELRAQAPLTLHIETATPVTSIRVPHPPRFIATEEDISVSGTFTDGITLEIIRSREITYSSSNPQVATVTSDGLIEAVDNGTATITVTYKNQSTAFPIKVDFKKLTVPLDIEPGERRKTINLDSGGHVRVAILSTPAFAASAVNARTVKFGPGGAAPELEHMQTEDVNGDGRPDLVLRFRIRDTGLRCGQSTATLTGRTVLGDQISGTDTIHVVGKACR